MTQQKAKNQAIIRRYTGQPERLPAQLRTRIERDWKGEPVQLYGLADLDARLQLSNTWVALGPTHLAIAEAESTRQGERGGVERRGRRVVDDSAHPTRGDHGRS